MANWEYASVYLIESGVIDRNSVLYYVLQSYCSVTLLKHILFNEINIFLNKLNISIKQIRRAAYLFFVRHRSIVSRFSQRYKSRKKTYNSGTKINTQYVPSRFIYSYAIRSLPHRSVVRLASHLCVLHAKFFSTSVLCVMDYSMRASRSSRHKGPEPGKMGVEARARAQGGWYGHSIRESRNDRLNSR